MALDGARADRPRRRRGSSASARARARSAAASASGRGGEHARQRGRRRVGRHEAHRVAVGLQGGVAVAGGPQVARRALADAAPRHRLFAARRRARSPAAEARPRGGARRRGSAASAAWPRPSVAELGAPSASATMSHISSARSRCCAGLGEGGLRGRRPAAHGRGERRGIRCAAYQWWRELGGRAPRRRAGSSLSASANAACSAPLAREQVAVDRLASSAWRKA